MIRCPSRAALLSGIGVLLAAACGGDSRDEAPPSREPQATTSIVDGAPDDEQQFPDVLGAEVERGAAGYDFEVTISSPYDTPERYADGWRVTGVDGTVYGEHTLAHDHAGEQPFTRTQRGVTIPDGIDQVVVEGRDSRHGYGGQTVTVALTDE